MSHTGNSLAIIERNLEPLRPRFDALVSPVGLDARRFMASIMLAVERNPRLLDFPVEQHVLCAMTASTLGLEPDGVTGQMFLLPFGGKRPVIQPVIGYKGMNTMAARAGIVIHGDVLRDGDRFDMTMQAGRPFAVDVSGNFGNRQRAPVIGAWAQAETPNGFSTPVLLDKSELAAVMARSPGAKKPDSPWRDTDGPGFAAMCAKTAKRRLQRTLPMILTRGLEGRNISQHVLGAEMDMQHEEVGRHSWIDGEAQVATEPLATEPQGPRYVITQARGETVCRDRDEYMQRWKDGLGRAERPDQIDAVIARNAVAFHAIAEAGDDEAPARIAAWAEERKAGLAEQ